MKSFFKAFLAGVAFWMGFAPFELWVAPIFGLFLLFDLLAGQRFKERFLLSFLTGVSFFLPLLHWSSTYVGAVPWLILAIGEALLFSLIGVFPIARQISGAALFSAGFILIELARMKFPFGGFGWGRLGFTQLDSLSHLYPVIGVTGIGFLIAAIAASAVVRKVFLAVPLLLFLLNQIPWNANISNQDVFHLVAVQGGVDELGLKFNDEPMRVLQRHIDATPKEIKADLILWPENSIDIDPSVNSIAKQKLSSLMTEVQAPLLAGVVEQGKLGPRNSSLLFNNQGEVVSRYVKQDLAPFGEYIPLRKLAESISPFAQQVRDFQAGKSWQAFQIGSWSFQSFICFEILDDDHVRAGAENMKFLVAQTNNATFGKSPQAAQQLQITRARAAELKKNFAVVSTTGFTAQINSDGKIEKQLMQFKPDALEMALESADGESIASHLGTGLWLAVAGLTLLITLLARYRYTR